jgi:ABC-type phosphate transport system ATPase subunit
LAEVQSSCLFVALVSDQGDQIGRIFAQCAFVYFGQFLEITEEEQILGLLSSTVQVMY